jgi:integrase/recombinase XerD
MSVDTYLGRYLEAMTQRGVRSLRKHPYWLKVYDQWLADRALSLHEVSPAMAEEFQASLATMERDGKPHYASGTIADIVTTVDGFYRYLVAKAHLSANPFMGMDRVKREAKLPRYLPTVKELCTKLDELATFWSATTLVGQRERYRTHVIAELAYATGLRLSEIASLEPADLDLDNCLVRVREGKGGKARSAYLSEYAVRVMGHYVRVRSVIVLGSNASLFGVKCGRNMETALNGSLKRYFNLTCHGLRHALGTHLLQRGCDLRHIQVILGHDDLKSTALYTKVSKEELKDQLDRYHPRSSL